MARKRDTKGTPEYFAKLAKAKARHAARMASISGNAAAIDENRAERRRAVAAWRKRVLSDPEKSVRYRKRRAELRKASYVPMDPAQKRRASLIRRYGITVEQYDVMFLAQAGACPICGEKLVQGGRALHAPHIDHCHKTGKVRGILCHRCNIGLGHMRDSVDFLAKAIVYLGGYK